MFLTWKRAAVSLAIVAVVAMFLACASPPQPTQWAEAQKQTQGQVAVAKDALDGKAFNKFFPKDLASPWDLVYEQDKKGTAIASLKKDGKQVATLSVTDTLSNPEAAEKFKDAPDKLAGFPHLKVGSHETNVLVADRFQVKVRAVPQADFTVADCDEWLQKFDLEGISKLQ
jgi:hypothetical protein